MPPIARYFGDGRALCGRVDDFIAASAYPFQSSESEAACAKPVGSQKQPVFNPEKGCRMESHVLAMCLRRAYLAFHRQVNAWMLKYGITADQFVMLRVAAREPGLMQIEIVDRMASDPNTVTAILRLLEQRGLILRKAHATDGRARCVFLTSRGRKLQQRAYEDSGPLRVALEECVIPGNLRQSEQFLKRVHEKFLTSIAETNAPPARQAGKRRTQRAIRT